MGNSLQQARANLQHLRDAVQSFLRVRVTCLLLARRRLAPNLVVATTRRSADASLCVTSAVRGESMSPAADHLVRRRRGLRLTRVSGWHPWGMMFRLSLLLLLLMQVWRARCMQLDAHGGV